VQNSALGLTTKISRSKPTGSCPPDWPEDLSWLRPPTSGRFYSRSDYHRLLDRHAYFFQAAANHLRSARYDYGFGFWPSAPLEPQSETPQARLTADNTAPATIW